MTRITVKADCLKDDSNNEDDSSIEVDYDFNNEDHFILFKYPYSFLVPIIPSKGRLPRSKGRLPQIKADCLKVKADCLEVKADCLEVKANCLEVKADCLEVKAYCPEVK